jgi:GT2 family glycosyltransferase
VTPPGLTAVVVTHNSESVIGPCLRLLRRSLPQAELIIVDNASTDGTAAEFDAVPGVVKIVNSENVGYGRACNLAATAATTSHLVFLNPDVGVESVDPDALEAELVCVPFGLVAPCFRERWRVAPVLFAHSHWLVDLCKHVIGPLRPRELRWLRSPVRPRGAWWPAGAMVLVARAEFLALGGFSPQLFLYYEDRDLARRYAAAGLPIRTSRSIVGHHERRTAASTGHSLRVATAAWAYMGWLEYLCTWHGRKTAARAARAAQRLRRGTEWTLRMLEALGPAVDRARRKRTELAAVDAFVQALVEEPAEPGRDTFFPLAREVVALLGASSVAGRSET